ncbi:protein bicaudal C homolog 1-like [Durio zibethinus]|uniref:Protein bicaudal C homolog 1-like n=1 Tax=Durio zibethinus TaxID=66656 RepID=A0A6P5Y999_DURZI|nr:protein bicaudal C homolog 1-like [Durio zibethinus]XP_022736575.1 protein bicaudal C homolog 1-like [Durio zibethinus]XP_022736576.1 protein bicaudal C homolog 1-like [Durio zibethinus]
MADVQQSDGPVNGVGGPVAVASSETVGSKRQRRPSVRLGDIGGDQPDSHIRRPSSSSAAAAFSKQWKHQSHLSLNPSVAVASSKSSKTRALTNLSTDFNANNETLDGEREPNNNNNNLDGVAIGSWRVKDFKKRGLAAKRVRSNWVSKIDDSSGGNISLNGNNNNTNNSNVETEDRYSGSEYSDDFDMENSESPMKEQNPIHSLDNLGVGDNEREVLYHGKNQRRPIRTRVSDGVELSGPSDTNLRRCEEDGVRIWLNSLGLGRYAPVFEIHEVDDEVLPLLTLEDLKDMGINAVGSRRKMFRAIQMLGKGFS